MERNELEMLYNKKGLIAISLLAITSLAVHFAFFGTPNSAVFDEVHFGKFISAYFTHEYYFDIHPPLGKLILAGWGWLWGFEPGFSFAEIGEVYPDHLYLALRFLPTLAGALLPLVIYGLARQLGFRRASAFLAGMLVALDNALLVQSRFILLDSFLLLFGFGALWCYFRWRQWGSVWLLGVAGLLGGAASSIKWTGGTFLAIMVILELIALWRQRHARPWRRLATGVGTLIAVPVAFYFIVFTVHFALLPKAGTGDAFMSPEFQHTLAGNAYANDASLRSPTLVEKFFELNVQMYLSNQRLTATHPYSSSWYTWPLMVRPVYYWVEDHARIYLLGNPLVWWLSTAAVLVLLAETLGAGILRASSRAQLLLAAWLVNILPFIGISRVMFLYHYLTALVWAILMLAYFVDRSPHARALAIGITIAAFVLFIFFAPLSYGLPLSDAAYHLRVWLPSWQ